MFFEWVTLTPSLQLFRGGHLIVNGVKMTPGATAFTRISGASSLAIPLVKESSADLEAP